MASHGRRYASARTIERKKAKKAMKQANTRIRKIGNSKFGTNHNPAIEAYRRAGKPKEFFKFEKGMNKFQLKRLLSFYIVRLPLRLVLKKFYVKLLKTF